jgi:hypothetical protein
VPSLSLDGRQRGENAFAEAWSAGYAATLEQAREYAPPESGRIDHGFH